MSYGFNEVECRIIMAQIQRRARMRMEFMRLRSDPCQHFLEAGHVFDPALQRFMAMKYTQLDHFTANVKTIRFGVFAFLLPMVATGYIIHKQRADTEREIRCGNLKYKDRLFKL